MDPLAVASDLVLEDLLFSDTDDTIVRPWGGSPKGRRPNKKRDFVGAYHRLHRMYFDADASTYDEKDFERRYRMPRDVFNVIYGAVEGEGRFVWKRNPVTKEMQIHPLNRVTAALRILGYGTPGDKEDEFIEMGESTILDATKEFCQIVVDKFADEYLRPPTMEEKARLLKLNKARGFPGMLASWDTSHFEWKNCPIIYQGQHRNRKGQTTLVLETVVDYDLRCWWAFFGTPGSCNDINVLDRSPTVADFLLNEDTLKAPKPYSINGTIRDWVYFNTDSIYPSWSIFAQSYPYGGRNYGERLFNTTGEGIRKDVERFYAVMPAKFQALARPLRYWYVSDLQIIVKCCIIMHNMVVEHKQKMRRELYGSDLPWWADKEDQSDEAVAARAAGDACREERTLFGFEALRPARGDICDMFNGRMAALSRRMTDPIEHIELRDDLMNELLLHNNRA